MYVASSVLLWYQVLDESSSEDHAQQLESYHVVGRVCSLDKV